MGSMEGVDIEVFRRVAPAKKRVPKTRKETNRSLEFYRDKKRDEKEERRQQILKNIDYYYSKIDQLFEEIMKL